MLAGLGIKVSHVSKSLTLWIAVTLWDIMLTIGSLPPKISWPYEIIAVHPLTQPPDCWCHHVSSCRQHISLMQVKCCNSRGRRRKEVGDVPYELRECQCIQLPLARRRLMEKVFLALSFQGEDEGEGGTSGNGKDCSNREGRQTSTSMKPGRKAKQAKVATCSVLTTWEGWTPMKRMESGWARLQGTGGQWPEAGRWHGGPAGEQIHGGGEERKVDLWWSGGMMVERQKVRDREESKSIQSTQWLRKGKENGATFLSWDKWSLVHNRDNDSFVPP